MKILLTKPKRGRGGFMFIEDGIEIDTADAITRLKKLHNLNSAHLAQMAGVSPRTVDGWVLGREPGRLPIMRLLAGLNRLEAKREKSVRAAVAKLNC